MEIIHIEVETSDFSEANVNVALSLPAGGDYEDEWTIEANVDVEFDVDCESFYGVFVKVKTIGLVDQDSKILNIKLLEDLFGIENPEVEKFLQESSEFEKAMEAELESQAESSRLEAEISNFESHPSYDHSRSFSSNYRNIR